MIASLFNLAFLFLVIGLAIWGGFAFARATRERLAKEAMLDQIRKEDAEKEAAFRRMAEAEVAGEPELETHEQKST